MAFFVPRYSCYRPSAGLVGRVRRAWERPFSKTVGCPVPAMRSARVSRAVETSG
ncbi:hypothetical protein ABZ614_32835 [Streptomyces sp. NPDC013178]|uniref:hypothetical protein n=1 Tax=Streptomyces sp. NPDC013178 TaxID=3155118 RepID=UPI0033E429E6